MTVVILLMFVAGVAMSVAASDSDQVTLRWLRLGGFVGLGLLSVAVAIAWQGGQGFEMQFWIDLAVLFLLLLGQTLAASSGDRSNQRIAAALALIVSIECIFAATAQTSLNADLFNTNTQLAWPYLWSAITLDPHAAVTVLMVILSAGVFGGFLMTMLLGHAYLTAGSEMTQAPFIRLVRLLALLLVARLGVSLAFGLQPYLTDEQPEFGQKFNLILITARYLVGMVIPCVLTYMIYDCVKRRSNQSATGILYVAVVILVIGEGIALSLLSSTGLIF